jgi:hypothetical protein
VKIAKPKRPIRRAVVRRQSRALDSGGNAEHHAPSKGRNARNHGTINRKLKERFNKQRVPDGTNSEELGVRAFLS